MPSEHRHPHGCPDDEADAGGIAPALAPDVILVGALQGSGFVEPQWLVRRGNRFIQVSELLYRVAEALDGTCSYDDVARRVTEATPWAVSGENIRQLIELKLLPLGVVGDRPLTAPADAATASSPLRIAAKRRLLAPHAVGLTADALKVFFLPPVAVAGAAAIVGANAWLYLVHGVGTGIHAALYTPGGLLLVVGLMAASGLVHELGHAAALRYGGGRPGAIGVGFYLAYPTAYTDTSDAYRLSRGARIRTDLGGIYFHLLLVPPLALLAAMTGYEPLVAVGVLIGADVVYQLIPTMRLDGYWAFADALGIPDPFSQVRALARKATQFPGTIGVPPALKPWPRRIFGAYVAVTLPALALLFALMLLNLPRLMGRAADIFRYNAHVLRDAVVVRDVLVGLAVSAQLVLLALMAIAVVILLYRSGASALASLGAWSRGRIGRRTVIGLSASGGFALLITAWATGVSWTPITFARHHPPAPAGTKTFAITSHNAVTGDVDYAQRPPVGGPYARIWENCGFYGVRIPNERAVHTLARGAVWIAYRPGVPSAEISVLRAVAHELDYILVSPYGQLPTPLVAVAWGKQLNLRTVADPRLAQFIAAFRLSKAAPESGGSCSGGAGRPG
jgi:putative peptide zinc metalloprotease protein